MDYIASVAQTRCRACPLLAQPSSCCGPPLTFPSYPARGSQARYAASARSSAPPSYLSGYMARRPRHESSGIGDEKAATAVGSGAPEGDAVDSKDLQ
jgi:hypothetical protein